MSGDEAPVWTTLLALLPLAVPLAGLLFDKPARQERGLDRAWKELLVAIRLKLATDLASAIPVKRSRTSDDDYLAQCTDALLNVVGGASQAFADLGQCYQLHRAGLRAIRVFRYIVIATIVAAVAWVFVGPLLFDGLVKPGPWPACLISVALVLPYAAAFLHKERRRDGFLDLCRRYEVVEAGDDAS